MDTEKRPPEEGQRLSDQPQTPNFSKNDAPTPLSKRILAGIGAILMVILTIAFAYSIATGNILKW